jgi:hypothetical protein
MTEHEGLFSIPTRLLLTLDQRDKLAAIVRARELDLAELVSGVIAAYLDSQPAPAPAALLDVAADVGKRRAELARLRAQRDASSSAPPWLAAYIAALEAEIDHLGQ